MPGYLGICGQLKGNSKDIFYGIEANAENFELIPEGFGDLTIPAYTCMIFKSIGKNPDAIQRTWERIYSEWMSSTKYEVILDVEVQRLVENIYEDTGKVKFCSIPSCEVDSLVYKGGYSRLKDINIYLAKWITQNGLEICAPAFIFYYVTPEHKVSEEKFITEVCFPVKKNKILTLA